MPRTDTHPYPPGDRVRILRVSLRMSQTELGALVGRSQKWVSAVENGRLSMSLRDAGAVAAALGADLSLYMDRAA